MSCDELLEARIPRNGAKFESVAESYGSTVAMAAARPTPPEPRPPAIYRTPFHTGAREHDLDVTTEAYPYTAASTGTSRNRQTYGR
jgi:hypothetical protein